MTDHSPRHSSSRTNFLLQFLREAAWAPILAFGVHLVIAKGFQGYIVCPPLDIPMHLAGGMAIAYFLLHSSRLADRAGFPIVSKDAVPFRFVITSTCIAAIVWEIGEFLTDRYYGTRSQIDWKDTLSDIMNGLIGAIIFLMLTIRRRPM